MTDTFTVEQVNELIQQHSDKARDAISQLETVCQQDANGLTPLNIAIESQNHEMTRLLADSEGAIHFFPKLDDNLLAPVKHSVSAVFDGKNVEETEKYLKRSFGPRICLQRMPLHVACRHADTDAIALLISRNAGTDAEDILGLTPLELCIQFGGATATARFIACCTEIGKRLKTSELALRTACADPALYQQLVRIGVLDIKAKRFAFSLACALLDKDVVRRLLEQGLDINKTMNDEYSPVLEVCTSRLLSHSDHPEAPRLAGLYAAAKGPGAAGIKIDSDAILNADSLEDIEALFSASFDDATNTQAEMTSCAPSEEERQAQLSLRLDLLDYLMEHGLDGSIAETKAPYGFVSDIVSTGSPELLGALVSKGFSLAPEPDYREADLYAALKNGQYALIEPLLQLGHQWGKLKKLYPDLAQAYSSWKKTHAAGVVGVKSARRVPARVAQSRRIKAVRKSKWTWELAGESVLLAETTPRKLTGSKPACIRVTHSNVYGPVDGVRLFVRIGDPGMPSTVDDLQGESEWLPLTLVEELLSVDGEDVDRSSLDEPVYGETPWEGTYEREMFLKRGKHSIEIGIASEIDGMAGVISDWTVNVT